MLWLLAFFISSAFADELWLKVGEVHRLPAPAGKAVRVGSHGVIKVIDGVSSVRVVGLKPGTTPLIVGENHYHVHVSFAAQKEFVQGLRRSLDQMLGLKLDTDGAVPSVRGTLLRFSDWLKLAELARSLNGEYEFKAQSLPDVGKKALQYFQDLARKRGFPIVRFRADPEFTVQVPHAAADLKAGVHELFRAFGIRVVENDSQLSLKPLVRTRVILAEIAKDNSRELGVHWPGEYTAQFLPQVEASEGLEATLKALEARGEAQILASPNLLCRSGSEAKFHAGGSFPVRMVSRLIHDVVWKEHGVLLDVKPEADFEGAISLEIETEISLVDMSNAVDGVPALKTNTVKSHFDLPGKRTVVLSGLLRHEIGNSKEGLPFLTALPVLGALFSSQKFQNHRSELVIFVTPEIYVPESDEKIEMPAGWTRDGA